jgi:ribosomal protein L34
MPKRTHQPKTRRQARKQGFRARMRKAVDVIKARRLKGRKKLTV